jgi:hypothetical protein
MAWFDWALGILLTLSVVLVCLAVGVYYGKRPEYEATTLPRPVPAKHSLEDREAGTVRIVPPHPRNLE